MEKFDVIVFTSGPKAYAPKRIEEECKKTGLKYTVVKYRDIKIDLSNKKGLEISLGNQAMPQAKGIFLRGIGEDTKYNALRFAILYWYKKAGTKVLNYESFNRWPSLDKTSQYINLVNGNLPVVDSYAFGNKDIIRSWAKSNYPFIAKDIVGSCGTGVYKINSDKELEDLLSSEDIRSVKTLLFQKFLEKGEDLRVIVLNGEVVGGMKRIAAKNQYLTNYSQGGSVEKYDVLKDSEAVKIAKSVAKLFRLDYCGVDLMRDNEGNWIVLEVNRACQFEGFEKSTGVNVAKKVVEYLTSHN